MGKAPLVAQRDVPGFIWNRIQFAVLRECLHMLETGVASAGGHRRRGVRRPGAPLGRGGPARDRRPRRPGDVRDDLRPAVPAPGERHGRSRRDHRTRRRGRAAAGVDAGRRRGAGPARRSPGRGSRDRGAPPRGSPGDPLVRAPVDALHGAPAARAARRGAGGGVRAGRVVVAAGRRRSTPGSTRCTPPGSG